MNREDLWKEFDRRKTPHDYEIITRFKELFMAFSEEERILLVELSRELKSLKEDFDDFKKDQKIIMDMYTQSKGVVRFIGWMTVVIATLAATWDYLVSHLSSLKH